MSRKLRITFKKGFSLVELIISVALLVSVLLPISLGFISAAAINKQSKAQLKLNSITRIVKEEVVDDVLSTGNRSDRNVPGTGTLAGYNYDIKNIQDNTTDKVVDLEIKIKNLKGKVLNVFNIKIYYGPKI